MDCDVCVVGTGGAGGILAYVLAEMGVGVLSLEQGAPIDDGYFTNELRPQQQEHFGIGADMPWPLSPTENYLYSNVEAQRLYAAEAAKSTSPQSQSVFVNHQMFRLNGKLNVWNAVALRYSARDFRGREFGDSDYNWPIGYDDLKDHYSAVERLIGVCGTREGLDVLPDGEFIPPPPLRPADKLILRKVKRIRGVDVRVIRNRKAVETRADRPNHCRNCGECIHGCASGSVYKFSSHLLPRISGRDNYRLRCHAKVVRLVRDNDSNRIDRLECLDTQTGEPFVVRTKIVVLCTGAFETPRILFNSRDESFGAGLANSSGLLGCYLQDKVKVVVGSALLRLWSDRTRYNEGYSDNLLIPRFLFDNREFRGGYQAQVCHFLPKHPSYLDGIRPFPAWLRPFLARKLFRTFVALMIQGKPEARRSNRVVPGGAVDEHGIAQLDVKYETPENDRRMQQSMIDYGRRILRACSGYITTPLVEPVPGGAVHYSGTARMAAAARDGVVDPDLRSFDHRNLYLCDGSVMPEVCEKNLTLTLMALAHRLGLHLANRCKTKDVLQTPAETTGDAAQ